ncbi:hypothetical protein PIROE2DRAFT_5794 [Piromyces sp. E2]|nr:hypothetical protein PIROE2DRAFT_5794 [Piromyces sp. E2]|eukprot:OUM66934.1 hypothetical protein PIROE2DRAFT_5794 [Piromyces sp. E2]
MKYTLFNNSIKKTILLIFTLALINNVNAYSFNKNEIKVSDKELNNPYVGLIHGVVSIDLNDYPAYDCNYVNTFSYVKNLKEPGLQYLGVRLAEFRDRKISEIALDGLRNLLDEYRKKKEEDKTLQIILRFYYDGVNNYKADKSTYKPIKNNRNSKRFDPISDSTSDSHLEVFENNNTVKRLYKRDKTFEDKLNEDANKSMYIKTRPIAKELSEIKINNKRKICIKQFNPSNKRDYVLYDTIDIEPNNIDRIKEHIVQLSEIVNEYKDLIYIHQGAFVGAHGEMFNSNYININSLSQIVNTIEKHFDPSIFLSVRTPAMFRKLEEKFKIDKAYNYTSFIKRMGLYNDGLFYSDDDCGTYVYSYSREEYPDHLGYVKKYRNSEVSFQKSLCLSVPNGGEGMFFADRNSEKARFNKFNYADEHARNIHLSYLNGESNKKLFNLWESTPSNEVSKIYPNWNVNGKECISRHLGYRYIIENSSIVNNKYLNINIKNVGYSSSYINFDVKLYLVEKNNESQVIPCNVSNDDTRKWVNDKSISLQFNLDSIKNEYKYELYDVYIRVIDENTDYPIKFGIDNEENKKYGYRIGDVNI